MDRLWTPWRYSYITGATPEVRKGVPAELRDWPGDPDGDPACVFCNLIRSVEWGIAQAGGDATSSERAGLVVARLQHSFLCLNAFPYSSGHVLLVPYRHTDSLASLDPAAAAELMATAQKVERVLREVYRPDGINLGLNLGEAAGAGVAQHLHLHMLPRWFGDTNFMTVTAETRVLPETLSVTWERIRKAFAALFPSTLFVSSSDSREDSN
jgi:ATP adenylyltransferase